MHKPLVSVITPTLNPGDYLRECIKSVEQQSYQSIEHIVIDGGSSDGTIEMLTRNDRVRWVSEPDSGQASAINKGFALSQGDLVGWLNADDILLPSAVEWAVQRSRHPTVGFVYGNVRVTTSKVSYVRRPPRKLRRIHVDTGSAVPQPGSFITSSSIERVGLLNESLHLVMDQEYFMRLFNEGIRGGYIPKTVAEFRIHDSSKTGSVPPEKWLQESVRVWIDNGHYEAGSVAFGRWAARSRIQQQISASDAIDRLVNQAISDCSWVATERIQRRPARAGATYELFRIERERGLNGVRRLFNKDVLGTPQVRQQVAREAAYRLTNGRSPYRI